MRRRRPGILPVAALRVPLLLLAAMAASPGRPAGAAEASPQALIESRLMCYCGCADLTVRVCTCGTADGIRREIAQRLADGETAEQVTAAFVARYGEKILSAPTTSGFNLLAWVTPFAVLLAAGAGLAIAVHRWGSRAPAGATPSGSTSLPLPQLDARQREVLKRVERELRERR